MLWACCIPHCPINTALLIFLSSLKSHLPKQTKTKNSTVFLVGFFSVWCWPWALVKNGQGSLVAMPFPPSLIALKYNFCTNWPLFNMCFLTAKLNEVNSITVEIQYNDTCLMWSFTWSTFHAKQGHQELDLECVCYVPAHMHPSQGSCINPLESATFQQREKWEKKMHQSPCSPEQGSPGCLWGMCPGRSCREADSTFRQGTI